MEVNKETENQIQELQLLEQNLQSILMQKQAFQMELSEVENALEELAKTSQDVYKIVGNVLIKSQKDLLLKDLKSKKELMSLRLKNLDNQEKTLSEESEKLREKVLSKIQNKK
jgi:prefoldin beta subunit